MEKRDVGIVLFPPIKKAIRGEPWGYKERSHQPFPVLDKYLTVIDGWLMGDKDKPKKQRHTARRIYNRLVEEHGYKGSEPTVRRYVRFAKMALGIDAPCAFIPCDPEAGHEGEVDWGHGDGDPGRGGDPAEVFLHAGGIAAVKCAIPRDFTKQGG